jgi:predicted dehydrogenase
MTLRAVLMGTGFWAGSAHLPALRAQPGLEVTTVVGRTLERASAFAHEHSIPSASGSLDEVIERERPDLIVIAAPDDIHPQATRAAIASGIPVFCEKPLANDAAVAHELAALAAAAVVPATVGYSFRYSPAIQALRADLLSGRLGDPWLIELFEYNAQFHPTNGKSMNWKGDPAHAKAGAIYEYGSHVVDIASWLVGPLRAVSASFTRVLPGARLDDVATLQLRFDPPAIGVLVAGWVLSGSIPGIRVRLHGSGGLGEVLLSETIPGRQTYRRYRLDGSIQDEPELEPLGDPRSGYAERHVADFIALISGRQPRFPATLPSLADGARVQDVLETALIATERWGLVGASEQEMEEVPK